MNSQDLIQMKRRELAQRARVAGVTGWHEMTKTELVAALAASPRGAADRAVEAAVQARRAPPQQRTSRLPPLEIAAARQPADEVDRVILLARDPYWLQAYWAVSRSAVLRSQAALGKDWYCAKPVLRLYDVTSEETSPGAEAVVRDVALPNPSVQHWYIDVGAAPPRSYRVDIGYLTARGRFFAAARSNVATSLQPHEAPRPGEVWRRIRHEFDRGRPRAESEDGLEELFRQRTRRPLSWGELEATDDPGAQNALPFVMEAELVVLGRCDPTTQVTVNDEAVSVGSNGTFSLRMRLHEGRQIIPATARGMMGDARTIVLAVERNTRILEPAVEANEA